MTVINLAERDSATIEDAVDMVENLMVIFSRINKKY